MIENEQSGAKSDRQELYLLYQNATANLTELKKSQWQVVVLFSAIVAFLITQADDMSSLTRVFLSLALLVGAISAGLMLRLYWQKIDTERKVLGNIYNRFGQEFRDCREPKGDVLVRDRFETLFEWGGYVYMVVIFVFAMVTFWC